MKKVFLLLLLLVSAVSISGQTKVVFMPCWIEQSQWAGYYMAAKHGFYEEEDLDVEFVHPKVNSTVSAFDMLVSGRVHIVTGHLATALKLRSEGYPIVNVLQTSQRSSQICVTKNRIDSIQELRGKKIARWKSEFGECYDILDSDYGLDIDWIPYIRDVNLFVFKAVDGILCCRYNEYISLLTSVGTIRPECVVDASEYGYDIPEDGLYVTKYYLARNRETVEKFVKASIRGWEYARTHQEEVLDYVLDLMKKNHIQTNTYSQREMLRIVLELQTDKLSGEADFAPVQIEKFYKFCGDMERTGKLLDPVKYTDFIKDLRPQ